MKNISNATTNTGEPLISAYLHSKATKLGIPVSGSFELTSRCNFNCRMCYIHTTDCNRNKDKELTAEQWLSIGRTACDNGMVFLLLTGGEPLIREDFAEIYTGLRNMGLVISVNTNGYFLDKYQDLFTNNPPSRINVSLYGAGKETYCNLCGVDGFERVKNNIIALKNAGIDVFINLGINKYNCGDLEGIYEFANSHDIRVRSAAYIYPPMRTESGVFGENDSRLCPEDAGKYRAKNDLLKLGRDEFIKRADNQFTMLNRGDDCPDENAFFTDRVQCRAGKSTFWIDWQGNMSPCGMFPDKVGNVIEMPFMEVWEKTRQFTADIRLPSKCVNCKYRMFCNVCAASCRCETGEFSKVPGYICDMTESAAVHYKKIADELKKEEK